MSGELYAVKRSRMKLTSKTQRERWAVPPAGPLPLLLRRVT